MKKLLKLSCSILMSMTLLLSACMILTPKTTYAKSKYAKAIASAKKNYNTINKKIKKGTYKDSGEKGVYKEYVDKNNNIRKILMYPGNGDMEINGYTVEYYYNSKRKLTFAFAYKKVNGKVKEYRAYYGSNGKLYRTINTKKKTKNYKKGVTAGYAKGMGEKLYLKGMWNIAVAYGG